MFLLGWLMTPEPIDPSCDNMEMKCVPCHQNSILEFANLFVLLFKKKKKWPETGIQCAPFAITTLLQIIVRRLSLSKFCPSRFTSFVSLKKKKKKMSTWVAWHVNWVFPLLCWPILIFIFIKPASAKILWQLRKFNMNLYTAWYGSWPSCEYMTWHGN